jgi:hypothetical protein
VSQGSVAARTIQLKWIWDGNKWNSDAEDAEETRPNFKGKKKGDVFNPTPTVDNPDIKGLAEQEKEKKIQPYLDLLDHLGGEIKDKSNVSGGHLLTAMQNKWKSEKFQIIKGEPNDNAVWECQWTIGSRQPKSSTMFPSKWDKSTLQEELMKSTSVGHRIILKSGIEIQKKGNTFYPLK